jgi:3-hydroxyisobutyrate dehydrogenase-like beta-hydroxyacid dehydrogenase
MSRIAILHPGHMGAEIGRALIDAGHSVGWLPVGRAESTRRRAFRAGLLELEDLIDREIVLSICSPAAPVETARVVHGFAGLYVDANAISPATASEVAAIVSNVGASYVDGGIVGPPPQQPGTTRLYLSGDEAEEVAALFHGTRVESVVLQGSDTAASALTITFDAWSKISAALVVSVWGVAKELAVADALAQEWARSGPELELRRAFAFGAAQEQGWRWVDEMREIAGTFTAAGEPAGFGEAAAELFGRWSRPSDD